MALTLIVILQVLLFKLSHLSARKLQDQGLSSYGVMSLQRYAIIPAVILFAATYESRHIQTILHTDALYFISGIALLWTIVQYSSYIILNSASSLSFVHALSAIIALPTLAIIGFLVNGDIPNTFAAFALIVLGIALLIKPATEQKHKIPLLRYSLITIILIILVRTITTSLDGAFYRNFLHFLEQGGIIFGISIYILVATTLLNIIYFFKPISEKDKSIIALNKKPAIAIPSFWFLGSIPEGFAYAGLPIFTMASLLSTSFIIDILSDFKNKRILPKLRTWIFVSLIILSIVLSTISIR